ncbi:hypothetical protein ACFOWA_19860 [Pedobacter lithocola]|uniref:Uncharacterized protein n=1 Tax=Pedobacter lithocola TaxID=1908239 RepID=A0ABV8PDQ4_9SPHI
MLSSKLKLLLIEISWLLLAAVITLLLCTLIFGLQIFQNSIDINLHDTYFVTQSSPIIFIFFIVISFTIYLIKEGKHSYRRKFQNLITLFLGFILLMCLSHLINIVATFASFEKFSQASSGESLDNGWTVHPPLEAKNSKSVGKFEPFKILSILIILTQLIAASLMIRLGYKWGQAKLF